MDRGKKGTGNRVFFSGLLLLCLLCVMVCVVAVWCGVGGKQILRASFVFSLLVVRFGSQTIFFFD